MVTTTAIGTRHGLIGPNQSPAHFRGQMAGGCRTGHHRTTRIAGGGGAGPARLQARRPQKIRGKWRLLLKIIAHLLGIRVGRGGRVVGVVGRGGVAWWWWVVVVGRPHVLVAGVGGYRRTPVCFP